MDHNIPAPSHPEYLRHLLDSTPARLGVWRAGARPLTATWLKFRQDHALARDAVHSEFSQDFLDNFVARHNFPLVQSIAADRRDYVLNPPKGKQVSTATIAELKASCPCHCDVQIVISDGLSAQAVESNIADLLPMLQHGFELEGITYGLPVVVRFGRVAVADQIGFSHSAKLAINLIGERPGLTTAQALSAYLTYNPGPATISSDRTVVSNIHSGGTPAAEAGAYIVQLAKRILETGASGVRLQQLG